VEIVTKLPIQDASIRPVPEKVRHGPKRRFGSILPEAEAGEVEAAEQRPYWPGSLRLRGRHDFKEGWIMVRRFVVGLVAYAAAGASAIPANANDTNAPPITLDSKIINLRCSADVTGGGPWTGALAYRIDFNDSTVNG
jgi:hypothetical protein